jgi:hypothetical protein
VQSTQQPNGICPARHRYGHAHSSAQVLPSDLRRTCHVTILKLYTAPHVEDQGRDSS